MDTSPFADGEGSYFVSVTNEEQHSLWPAFADDASGWRDVCGDAARAACLDNTEPNWTDIRSKSLRERLAKRSQS
jgi:glycopeptidolipid biosynthesis protein